MPATPLTTAVRNSDGIAIIDLQGEINAFAEPALVAAYETAERQAPSAMLLLFQKVTYINSTGIALIVSLLSRSQRAGRQLHVAGLSAHYREIFRITRLTDFMTVFPDEASALVGMAAA